MRPPEGLQPQRPGRAPTPGLPGRPKLCRSQATSPAWREWQGCVPPCAHRASVRASERTSDPLSGATRRWLASGVRDTRAIVSDPRLRPIREGQAAFPTRGRERSGPDRSARS